jgi:chromosome segregation ATPase
VQTELNQQAAEKVRLESECRKLTAANESLALEKSTLRENLTGIEAKALDAERLVQESAISLARMTADLKKERDERTRIEQRAASLATHLRGLHSDLSKHLADESVTAS